MRYSPEQKAQTRAKIVSAAGKTFRKGGYAGIGVDGLAKEAGVTSGAFYGHFKSKKEAFSEAISTGLQELEDAISQFREQHGEEWWQAFAKFYLSEKRTCDLAESCALQSLTPEVARSDDEIKATFETELLAVIKAANSTNKTETLSNLAMLVGAVTLARAVEDSKLSNQIAQAAMRRINNS